MWSLEILTSVTTHTTGVINAIGALTFTVIIFMAANNAAHDEFLLNKRRYTMTRVFLWATGLWLSIALLFAPIVIKNNIIAIACLVPIWAAILVGIIRCIDVVRPQSPRRICLAFSGICGLMSGYTILSVATLITSFVIPHGFS